MERFKENDEFKYKMQKGYNLMEKSSASFWIENEMKNISIE